VIRNYSSRNAAIIRRAPGTAPPSCDVVVDML
jgi:hypothetical protein